MERERMRFNYGILLAIGLIAIALTMGIIQLGWSGSAVFNLVQWILVGLAIACGIVYIVGTLVRYFSRDRSQFSPRPSRLTSGPHNPPRPGQPISRDRSFEESARKSGPQAFSGHRVEAERRHKGPYTPTSRVVPVSKKESEQPPFSTQPRGENRRVSEQSSLPVVAFSEETDHKPRRRRRRRGGRGKAPSPPAE
jgi:hypothetical protein